MIKQINWLVISAILLIALILNLLRIYLPGTFTNQRAYFEQWASQAVRVPVKIEGIHVEWHHFSPMIAFDHVTVLTQNSKPLLYIQELDIQINLFDSLLNWKLLPGIVILDGAHLELRQSASSQLNFDDTSYLSGKDLLRQTLSWNDTLTWLLTQGTVVLQNVSVSWRRPDGTIVPIKKLNLQITQKGFGRSIVGNAELANDLTHRVVFGAVLKNLDLQKMRFDSDIYLYLNDMHLVNWSKLPFIAQYLAKYKVSQGEANVQVWMQWKRMRLRSIQAEINAEKIIIQTPIANQKWVIGDLSANAAWKGFGQGWQITADHIRAHFNDEEWFDNAIGIENSEATVDQAAYQILALKFLKMLDIKLVLAQLPNFNPDIKRNFLKLNPQGSLNNLVVRHEGHEAWDANSVKLSADLSQLSADAWDEWPEFSHLSGCLYWSRQMTQLSIDSHEFSLRWPAVFSAPLLLNQFKLNLNYLPTENQWTLNVNSFLLADDNASIQGMLNYNHSDSNNQLSIDSKFNFSDLSQIAAYLPQSKMDVDLYSWLVSSFKQGGSISSGAFIFEGNPADFPFEKAQGHFQALANVKDVNLEFDPAWPVVEKINGELFFDNALMHIDDTHAVIAGNPITHINAVIPDLAQALLLVEGHVDSDLAAGLSFLQNTPMELGQKMKVLALKGLLNLDLKLQIPLSKLADAHYKFQTLGHLTTDNAYMNLLPLNLELTDLKGRFDFTEDSITAPSVTAKLYNDPISIVIDTLKLKTAPPVAQFNFIGRFDVDQLQKKLNNKWLNFFHGSAAYQAQYNLYLGDSKEQNLFSLVSNLQGISIDADSLYHKSADQIVMLEGSAKIKDGQPILLDARYGSDLSLALSFLRQGNNLELASGELAVRSELAQQQSTPGFVVSLNLPSFDWSKWQAVIAKYSDFLTAENLKAADFLRLIHLKADTVELYNHHLKKVDLQLRPTEAQWQIDITCPTVAGKIILPRNSEHPSVKAELEHLYVAADDSLDSRESNLAAWPTLELTIDDLRYLDRSLGYVIWQSHPIPKGLEINKLELSSSDYDLVLSGSSVIDKLKKYSSEISGRINSRNFGTLLNNLKISSDLADADGVIDFSLHWLGSISKPQLPSLTGYLDLDLKDGVIVHLSNGARSSIGFGRLMNLFSLQILPSLSHLSSKGFDFTMLKGHFDLKNGNATTSTVMMDGPIAKVVAKGRIGFVAQDYDIVMTVRPYVTSSLPTIAGLALANPIIGLVGWVVNKVVISPAVSRAMQFEYQITGPWQKPTVIELGKSQSNP